jgi:transcriptional regulator NrdR family protein
MFTTEEQTQHGGVWRVRGKSGVLEPFSRDKLFLSLYRSCQHRLDALGDAGGLTATIMQKLAGRITDGVVERVDIVQTVQVALNRFDRAASVHYQAFHL